jgi:hypothetical protein
MSAAKLPSWFLSTDWRIADPGASGTANLSNKGRAVLAIVTATTETRTIPAPEKVGQELIVYMDTDGGDATVTITSGHGNTSIVLNDVGDYFVLKSIKVSGTAKWVVASSYGVAVTSSGATTFSSIVTNSIGGAGSTVAFTDRITTTDGVSSGTAGVVGRLLYANTAASTAIASTSAETVFDTNYTMPANTLKAGSVVKIRYQGIGTTVVGTDTLAHKLYIGGSGGTALISSAATTMVNNHTFNGEAVLICRTAGTTGTFVATGTYKVNSAEGTMTVKDDITASTTINTQATQLITASAQFNTSNANSVRMDVFAVEIY